MPDDATTTTTTTTPVPIPPTMRAWTATKNGAPSAALTLQPTHPVPRPRAGNLLVKVSHAALNPADVNFMANLPVWIPFRRNPVVGLDFAGTVVAAAGSAAEIAVGAEVCGALNVLSVAVGRGSLAEYVEVPASKVCVRPRNIGPADAAGAMGVAGQTAWVVLKEASIKPGDRVLVNGASGGVGCVLVQVARAMGAVVIGVCSGANAELVRSLGADEVVDYTAHASLTSHLAQAYAADANPLHFIIDCVGSDELFRRSAGYLEKNGLFITIVGGVGAVPIARSKLLPVALGGVPRRYKLLALWPDGKIANEVARWVKNGHFSRFLTDSEYAMEDAVKAYERVASKRAKGKVIVNIATQ